MTGLAFMGLLGKVNRDYKIATRKMERRRDALNVSNSLHNSIRVSQTHDVKMNETLMIDYFEAVEEVEKILAQKNRVLDLMDTKLSLLKTAHGEEVLRARYIDGKSMEKIADELHYSRPGIYKLLTRAMAELDQIVADYDVLDATDDMFRAMKGPSEENKAV